MGTRRHRWHDLFPATPVRRLSVPSALTESALASVDLYMRTGSRRAGFSARAVAGAHRVMAKALTASVEVPSRNSSISGFATRHLLPTVAACSAHVRAILKAARVVLAEGD